MAAFTVDSGELVVGRGWAEVSASESEADRLAGVCRIRSRELSELLVGGKVSSSLPKPRVWDNRMKLKPCWVGRKDQGPRGSVPSKCPSNLEWPPQHLVQNHTTSAAEAPVLWPLPRAPITKREKSGLDPHVPH